VLELTKLHLSPAHWAEKKGVEAGRPIYDASDGKYGRALNSKEAKNRLKAHYGEIHHPTIEGLVNMVCEYAEEQMVLLGDLFDWMDLCLFKADLAGAFSLLSHRSADVSKMASELTDGLCAIFHAGVFGWVGTPYCFAVVTRILEAEINKRLQQVGRVGMYVDDINGVSMDRYMPQASNISVSVVKDLMGDLAHAEHKDEVGKVLDFIGYEVSIPTASVSISQRNFDKVLFGFCSVDVTKPVAIGVLEKLCSWSARYTLVLRVLRPITTILYAEKKGLGRNKKVTVMLSPLGRVGVYVWRAVLVLLKLRHDTFSRSFQSFRTVAPTYQIEYDASLTGIGIIIRKLSDYDPLDPVSGIIGVTGIRFPFDLGQDSKYQNTCEYIGATLGLSMLAKLGVTKQTVKLKGDSMSSLKWGRKGLFKGSLSRRATFVHMLSSVQFDLLVGETEHIEGIRHIWCDGLSRGKTPHELGIPDGSWIDVSSDAVMMSLIELCDPRPDLEIVDESSFFSFWRSVRSLLTRL